MTAATLVVVDFVVVDDWQLVDPAVCSLWYRLVRFLPRIENASGMVIRLAQRPLHVENVLLACSRK